MQDSKSINRGIERSAGSKKVEGKHEERGKEKMVYTRTKSDG